MKPQFIIIIVIVVFVLGTFAGFMIGFSRAIREAAKSRQDLIVLSILRSLIGVGCLAIIGALIALFYTWHFTRVAERTTGTVIDMVANSDPNSNGSSYAPTFRFQDAGGVQHTVISHFSSSPPEFYVGERVKVLYLPDDPQRARIDTYLQVWGIPTLLGIFGGISLSISLVFSYCRRVRPNSE